MPLDPEIVALLGRGRDAYKEGLEDANPVPRDGVYLALLTKMSASDVQMSDKQSPGKKIPGTKVNMSLKIIGDQVYNEYTFRTGFWSNSSSSMGQFGTFALASAAANPQRAPTDPLPNDPVQAYEVLQAEVGRGVFEILIERSKNKTTGKEYVNITARRRLTDADVQAGL